MSWCVVHVHAGRELAAADLLRRNLHLEVYLPKVLQRRHGKMQMGPLFPGYLFVHDDLVAEGIALVDVTPGCGRLLRLGAGSAPADERVHVAEEVIRQLQHKVDTFNQAGGLPAHRLQPGDAVQILAGAMCGLNAVFLGPLTPSARIQVLLYFLGREQVVSVAVDSVEACAPARKRERRTRGHGRPIDSCHQATAGNGRS